MVCKIITKKTINENSKSCNDYDNSIIIISDTLAWDWILFIDIFDHAFNLPNFIKLYSN